MTKIVNIKKGLDIRIRGAAPAGVPVDVVPATCAIVPDDFPGITPKVDVKEGDEVAVGTVLFHDKTYPDIRVVAPMAGKVAEVVRGERRKLERIVIAPEKDPALSLDFEVTNINDAIRARRLLLDSGLWAWMRQRPYNVVPSPGVEPRDIFITGFDSAPLAPDFEILLAGKEKELAAAVKLLQNLTSGSVYIGVRDGSSLAALDGVETVVFNGPHPAGNVGIQIGNVKPVNKGDTVWTLDALTLMRMGSLVTTGKLDMSTTVALTGCEVTEPRYIRTRVGADMESVLKGAVKDDAIHHRNISGNVLTGIPVTVKDYLRFPYYQVTVIAEGDDVAEFLGWASLAPHKMSVNRSFPGHFSKKRFCPDARILGGRRAMIMSGVYDKVFPLDVLPEFLVKAIIARDIDRMEQLGIYEVAPEDFALCEYVDPSKLELQKIVQEGIDYIRKELS